jgi:[acyl-carrier-protein] S-malonyltransferase
MGKELAEEFPAAKARFEEADAFLRQVWEKPLSRLCWEGPAEQLTRTEFCQPALYVSSLAALAALEAELGHKLTPAAGAGLSLGEYTALAAAGALSLADGLKLVRRRGQAMEEAARARPGTMASVLGLELEPLQELFAETGAQVANLNSPGQVVISGTAESVTAASAKAKEKGAKRVIPLEVGGAFHSRLMAPAAARLAEALKNLPVQPPRYPVASNVTGAYHRQAGQIGPLLVRQLTEPVQWVACVRTMAEKGINTYIEVGPGTVLKGLVRKINPEATVHSAGTSDEIRNLTNPNGWL